MPSHYHNYTHPNRPPGLGCTLPPPPARPRVHNHPILPDDPSTPDPLQHLTPFLLQQLCPGLSLPEEDMKSGLLVLLDPEPGSTLDIYPFDGSAL
jgi:hypothetical protein